MQRSSLFFNQWLGPGRGGSQSPRDVTRFKQYVEQVELESEQKVADLLPVIRIRPKRTKRGRRRPTMAINNSAALS